MTTPERTLPDVVQKLHELSFTGDDGRGIDFEPYEAFLSAEETADWIRAWTGNSELDGSEYLVFGQDGTGGYAAFWLARPERPLLAQPIVFFGSEGELGVVASDFADYLWLLAGGIGPYEAIASGPEGESNSVFEAFARAHAETPKTPADVLTKARNEFPKFEETVRGLCR